MSDSRVKKEQPYFTIPVDMIDFDGGSIRRSRTDISGLKQTISDVGLLQPVLLRKSGSRYVVIDGERRLRAMKDLAITELIVGRDVIVDVEETSADVKFKQIIANVQREDINDVELGHALILLKEQYGYQYNEIAEIIGKTPHYVSAKVGLAKRLSPEVQALYVRDIESGKCNPVTMPGIHEAPDEPYHMSVKVVETIARLPRELQPIAYTAIREQEMDKKEALQYLQSIRGELRSVAADNATGIIVRENESGRSDNGRARQKSMRTCLYRLDRDIDRLMENVSAGGCEIDLIPELESLIDRLRSLQTELLVSNDCRSAEVPMIYP